MLEGWKETRKKKKLLGLVPNAQEAESPRVSTCLYSEETSWIWGREVGIQRRIRWATETNLEPLLMHQRLRVWALCAAVSRCARGHLSRGWASSPVRRPQPAGRQRTGRCTHTGLGPWPSGRLHTPQHWPGEGQVGKRRRRRGWDYQAC